MIQIAIIEGIPKSNQNLANFARARNLLRTNRKILRRMSFEQIEKLTDSTLRETPGAEVRRRMERRNQILEEK